MNVVMNVSFTVLVSKPAFTECEVTGMRVADHQHLVATTIWTLDLYSEERIIDDTNVVDYIALIHTGNFIWYHSSIIQ